MTPEIEPTEIKSFISAILEGDCAESLSQARRLCNAGVSKEHIVNHGLEAAMTALDGKCTVDNFNLLEIMLAGRAVTEVMKFLYPDGEVTGSAKGTVVVATLEGDVHDLGKNILKTILTGKGYRVVDCGKDCPLPKLVSTVEQEKPLAVAISGLITPVIPQVKKVKEQLRKRTLTKVKVIAGGAALKQSSSEQLNVDFVGESAFDSLRYLESVFGRAK